MGMIDRIKNALLPKSYPRTEFGLEDLDFFLALLRACPDGSRLSFDRSEPESFVQAFRPWSHRDQPDTFEADYYTICDDLRAEAERLVGGGQLELDHHFGIVAADGRSLCSSLDDFTVVTLADDIRRQITTPPSR